MPLPRSCRRLGEQPCPQPINVCALARRQQGVFLLSQALELGFARSTIARRLERHTWEEVVPRVYRSSVSRPVDWRQRAMAVTLVTKGVASGASAGALFELVPPPDLAEVTASRPSRLALPAVVHTSCELPPADVTKVDGIPATTPVRTVIDLGGLLPLVVFEDVLDTAIVKRLVRVDRLATRAHELWAPRRRGCAVVLALLAMRSPELRRARNLWEARVLRVVRELGMPEPRVNYRVQVGGKRRYLDLAWPDAKVAVEFDGFVPHSTRRVFDDDRARQNDLVADRWTVFRATKTMLDRDPAGMFRPIAAVLAQDWSARPVGGQLSRSTTMAMPWPPPTHMLSSP